jgi:hypothetical protein
VRSVVRLLVAPADFVMMNQVLGGIKQRAERAWSSRASAACPSGTHGSMVVVEEEVDIRRPPEEVFDYCADLTHEPEWNPKMRHVETLTDGTVGVGMRYVAHLVPGDPMVIECVRFDRPTGWATVGESRSLKAVGEGWVLPTKDGAHLVLRMKLAPQGLLRFARPLLRRYMQPQLKRDLAAIKARLEASV